MHIDDTTLERAAFTALRHCYASHDNQVSYLRLQGAWSRTGLRDADLRDAVRVLSERGYVDVFDEQHGLSLRLTADGVRRSSEKSVHIERLASEVRDSMNLMRARFRQRNADAMVDAARRQADHI